jgi:hypothetical protein
VRLAKFTEPNLAQVSTKSINGCGQHEIFPCRI